MKEIRIRPRIAENDLKTKLKQVQKFLKKGQRVRIVVLFKRWEKKTMMEIAKEKANKFAALGKVISPLQIKGNKMVMTVG